MAQVYEIKITVVAIKQEDKFVTDYATSLQSLWQELNHYQVITMKCPENAATLKTCFAKERLYGFLAGLNLEFDQVRV